VPRRLPAFESVHLVALPTRWAYGDLVATLLHPRYLPFTADQLRAHFAPVLGPGELDRHLTYYLASVEQAKIYAGLIGRGIKPTPVQTRLGRQMEKDERFWLATALMSLYHQDDGAARAETFGRLLERGGLRPPSSFDRWADALAGPLELFFEVNLPSPPGYRAWLRDHLNERVPIPYLREKAEASGSRLEGATKADAMLLAPGTGVAVIFEAKVLSDVSTHTTFDVARNQLARTIDVMLEANPKLQPPLCLREPEQTFLMLLTPALLQAGETGTAASGSRLYGWLMPAYQDLNGSLLQQHLPHRDDHELAEVSKRLGWASWEDCHSLVPGACSWLAANPSST
jgi:hypothetical protein